MANFGLNFSVLATPGSIFLMVYDLQVAAAAIHV